RGTTARLVAAGAGGSVRVREVGRQGGAAYRDLFRRGRPGAAARGRGRGFIPFFTRSAAPARVWRSRPARRGASASRAVSCARIMAGSGKDLGPCPYCGKPHADSVLLCPESEKLLPLEGRILDGKFRFVRLLGEGGMGAV